MNFLVGLQVLFFIVGLVLAHPSDNACNLPPAINGNTMGNCNQFIPSWSYYFTENECQVFIFGGCGGNGNRFNNKDICEKTCKRPDLWG